MTRRLFHPFSQITEIAAIDSTETFRRLDDGQILVTVNKRLSRELQQKYGKYKSGAGFKAWETPQIIPFDAWVHHLWQYLNRIDSGEGVGHESDPVSGFVLNPLQSRMIWKSIIEKDIAQNNPETRPLWSIDATTRTAMHAWHLLHTWLIDLKTCAQSPVADYRRFIIWANRYGKICRQKGWIDPSTLTSSVIDRIKQIQHPVADSCNLSPDHAPGGIFDEWTTGLIFAGFDHFTNQQMGLISVFQDSDTEIALSRNTETFSVKQQNLEFDSEYLQWLGAAYWAREKIQQNKAARLAIIAPDLHQSRRIIEHVLSQVLCPGSLTGEDNRQQIFHISLGKPLIEFPVIDVAMALLSFASGMKKATLTIQKLLLGPYIAGAEEERQERSKLDIALRKVLPFEIDINRLSAAIQSDDQTKKTLHATVPILRESLKCVIDLQACWPKMMAFSDWVEHFLKCLNSFGWPGPASLNSQEFQVIEAFKTELKIMGSLDAVSSPSGFRDVLDCLYSRVAEKLFEGESSNPTIEVLDVPESAGLEFDAIWFGGMVENDWPPLASTSPFIPGYLQKESGCFRASNERILEHAQIQQNRLADQTNELIFSYHRYDKEVVVKPSPLIDGSFEPGTPCDSLFVQINKSAVEFEYYNDHYGLVYDPVNRDGQAGNNRSGGTRLIENQSACAFRAYAIHRLGSQYVDARDQGLNALDRGQLIHRVLEEVWNKIQTSINLKALDQGELEKMVLDIIKRNNKKFIYSSGCDPGFFDTHTQWLQQLLLEWFDLEKDRNLDFSVDATELSIKLQIAGLELNFKVDRIDRLSDDSLCLIDYKTGKAVALPGWTGERPAYPQLALYALALEPIQSNNPKNPLSVLVVGQIKSGDLQFRGFSLKEPYYSDDKRNGVPALEKTRLPENLRDWTALQSHWQETLSALAQDYKAGCAEVNPENNATCEYCDLHGLCRIYEKKHLGLTG